MILTTDSGSVHPTIIVNGAERERVPFGQEGDDWWSALGGPPESCNDCAQPIGAVHWLACDMDQCPSCGEQLLGCECEAGLPEGAK